MPAERFFIAIDDFESGYSLFEYLIEKFFNLIKLDLSLIRQITTNFSKVAIVEVILLLVKNLHFRVVAGGVETEEQYAILKVMGIDDIQGYFISKPAFIEDKC